ncbi:putative CLIP-associated protein [Blattamonas nauphoetae]|uniref:CLIP-associated protein n=1 Tax=Blattamonas nauphoetae TaxID=2049346 RepID=A0ABQ9XRR4_9EUKA|nr:putative CLIP-associated protein [Blattamonas nauphoetae]
MSLASFLPDLESKEIRRQLEALPRLEQKLSALEEIPQDGTLHQILDALSTLLKSSNFRVVDSALDCITIITTSFPTPALFTSVIPQIFVAIGKDCMGNSRDSTKNKSISLVLSFLSFCDPSQVLDRVLKSALDQKSPNSKLNGLHLIQNIVEEPDSEYDPKMLSKLFAPCIPLIVPCIWDSTQPVRTLSVTVLSSLCINCDRSFVDSLQSHIVSPRFKGSPKSLEQIREIISTVPPPIEAQHRKPQNVQSHSQPPTPPTMTQGRSGRTTPFSTPSPAMPRNPMNITWFTNEKKLTAELDAIVNTLKTIHVQDKNWNERLTAIQRLKSLASGDCCSHPVFISYIQRQLRPLISNQFLDGRSAFIKELCETVAAIAINSLDKCEYIQDVFLDDLLKLTGSTNPIMRDGATAAITAFLKSCSCSRMVAPISACLKQKRDRATVQRTRAATFLKLILEAHDVVVAQEDVIAAQPYVTHLSDKNLDEIASAIGAGLSDPDPETRSIVRIVYVLFERAYPARADQLFREKNVEQNAWRAIEADRDKIEQLIEAEEDALITETIQRAPNWRTTTSNSERPSSPHLHEASPLITSLTPIQTSRDSQADRKTVKKTFKPLKITSRLAEDATPEQSFQPQRNVPLTARMYTRKDTSDSTVSEESPDPFINVQPTPSPQASPGLQPMATTPSFKKRRLMARQGRSNSSQSTRSSDALPSLAPAPTQNAFLDEDTIEQNPQTSLNMPYEIPSQNPTESEQEEMLFERSHSIRSNDSFQQRGPSFAFEESSQMVQTKQTRVSKRKRFEEIVTQNQQHSPIKKRFEKLLKDEDTKTDTHLRRNDSLESPPHSPEIISPIPQPATMKKATSARIQKLVDLLCSPSSSTLSHSDVANVIQKSVIAPLEKLMDRFEREPDSIHAFQTQLSDIECVVSALLSHHLTSVFRYDTLQPFFKVLLTCTSRKSMGPLVTMASSCLEATLTAATPTQNDFSSTELLDRITTVVVELLNEYIHSNSFSTPKRASREIIPAPDGLCDIIRICPLVVRQYPPEKRIEMLPTLLTALFILLKHESAEVRKTTVDCIVAFYSIINDALIPFLDVLEESRRQIILFYITRAKGKALH